MDKHVAIVLGGTYPHKRLIELLKIRGYYVILIDYLDYSPAVEVADLHIKESTLDKEKVYKIANDSNARLVISTCIDQANVTACYVGEKLNLPIPYSYETALKVTNKVKMKEIFKEHNIPTADFVWCDSLEDCENIKLKYPLIVKPSDSNSSKGVVKVSNIEELKLNVKNAIDISRSNQAIVEEFIDGIEIAFDTIIDNGKANLVISRERCKLHNINGENQQISGSLWPARINSDLEQRYKEIIQKISKVFHLDNTPLMIQTIYDGTEIFVLEFAPRIGGGDNYDIIKRATGCEIINVAIDSFLNKELRYSWKKAEKYYYDNYLYMRHGIFGNVSNLNKLQNSNLIEYFKIYKRKGEEIGCELSSNNRVGVITVSGADIGEIEKKRNIVLNTIDIKDINKTSVARKELLSYSFLKKNINRSDRL